METAGKQGIVITGEGIVCAAGLDKDTLLRSLTERKSGVERMHYLHAAEPDLPVGEVKMTTEEMRRRLGIKSDLIGRTPLMGIMAIDEALRDAGIKAESTDDEELHVVLVSGTTVGGMDITEQKFCQMVDEGAASDCLKYHDCGSSTRVMADYFGLFDACTTPSTACSSAANAIILGSRLLESGEADIVVAGGSEALSRFHFTGFNSLMILDKDICRPFDAQRHGLNLGEGAAFVVMEREDDALKRGAKIHAWLTGYGNACDAYHQTATSPDARGAVRAMEEALKMARLRPEDIQYVNAHGTGTENNDKTESTAIRRVFGSRLPAVSSTKPFTGHTTSASGSIEAVISIMAMRHRFVPANPGFCNEDPETIRPSAGEDNAELHNVMCNSFGFGGNDSVLILSDNRQAADDLSEEETTGHEIHQTVVTIDSEEQLSELKRYVKPMEARRMCRLMKAAMLSSLMALEQAGVSCPDAIITATARGCVENSERFGLQMLREGAAAASPTLFMQSTHNTIASMIAMRLGCHGYNMTYSQEGQSFDWALRDARMLIESGRAKTVLVEYHDEMTDSLRPLLPAGCKAAGDKRFTSTAIVLSC